MKKYWGLLLLVSGLLVFLLSPLAFPIEIFTVEETEKVSIRPKVEDPDNDKITITYGPPLNENGEWQTSYGDAGEYRTKVTVSDGQTEDSDEILIIVNKKNSPPAISSYNPLKNKIIIEENEDIGFEISATDPNNDKLSYFWTLNTDFVSDSDSYTFGTSFDSAGTYKVTARVSDGSLDTEKEWEVVVKDVSFKPTFDRIPYHEITENEEVVIELKASAEDGDAVAITSPNLPEGAALENNIFRWKPDFNAVKADNFAGIMLQNFRLLSKTYKIRFIAQSRDSTIERIASIKVNDFNRQPVLEEFPTMVVDEGQTLFIQPKATDPDDNKLRYSYYGWIDFDTYTPSYDEQGIYYVKVTASDGLLADSKFVKVIVNNVNRAPEFKQVPSLSVKEGEELYIELSAYEPDNDELVFSLSSQPPNSSLDSNIFKWTPPYDTATGSSKEIALKFTASDGALTDSEEAVINVADVNRKPKIVNYLPQETKFKINQPVVFSIDTIDGDGDKLSYTWDFGLFEKYEGSNKHKRVFTSEGTKKVRVIVSDGKESIEHEWNIKII